MIPICVYSHRANFGVMSVWNSYPELEVYIGIEWRSVNCVFRVWCNFSSWQMNLNISVKAYIMGMCTITQLFSMSFIESVQILISAVRKGAQCCWFGSFVAKMGDFGCKNVWFCHWKVVRNCEKIRNGMWCCWIGSFVVKMGDFCCKN